MVICWSFRADTARPVAWPDRSTARPSAQCRASARSVQGLGVDAGVAAQGVVGELEVVALSDEDGERPVSVSGRLRWGREAAREQLERGGHLGGMVLLGERGGDQLAVDAERVELALYAVGAPGVQ